MDRFTELENKVTAAAGEVERVASEVKRAGCLNPAIARALQSLVRQLTGCIGDRVVTEGELEGVLDQCDRTLGDLLEQLMTKEQ